jgi:phage terminase large subunit GpA-like protein
MDALNDPRVREVVGVFASQTGKTDCVLNMIASRISDNPGPILVVQPTLEMGEAWSKDRLSPMLRDTPCLRGKVRDARTRDSGNTLRHKQFPGGHLTVAGANSAAGLSMRPIRDLFCDEVDRYPASAGTEGDPVRLAETRTRAFWNAKRVYISSPGTSGASRLERLWEKSDQRQFYVPCRDCGAEQTLKWSQVSWTKDPETGGHQPETACYVCERCGSAWNDVQRWAAVRKGVWRATKPANGTAGFLVNALAAPWEQCRLEELVRAWLEAQGNPELLKVFLNTVLAEWWVEQYETVDETGLLKRRESMPRRGDRIEVPPGAALLTAGVDVQQNRLEVSVYGWGLGEESWLLRHEVLYGDPSADALWSDLDGFLRSTWPRSLGGVDYIRGAAVDTGDNTQRAYDFCAPRFRLPTPDGGRSFVFAIKGRSGPGDVWPSRSGKVAANKVPLWTVHVDAAKEQVYGRLGIVEPGPGYIHFDQELEQPFFAGLTAEKVVLRTTKKGFVERTWALRRAGMRNEPLDCAVYALAALCGLRALGFDLDSEVRNVASRPVYEAKPEPTTASAPVPYENLPPQAGPPAGRQWLGDRRGWLRR